MLDFFVIWTLGKKLQENFVPCRNLFIHKIASGNFVYDLAAILSRADELDILAILLGADVFCISCIYDSLMSIECHKTNG